MKNDTANPLTTNWASHREALHRFVRLRVAEDDAEDIVQEVLTRAFARRDTLEDANKLRQWLYQIARNAIADHYRSQRSFAVLPETLAAEPEATEAARDLARCLPLFLERLPSAYRRAVRLSELEGLTQRDTAGRLGLSVSGAKSRVQRARGMLAAMFRRCCDLDFDARGVLVDYEPRRNPDRRRVCG